LADRDPRVLAGALFSMSRPSQVLLIVVVYFAGVAAARANGAIDLSALLIGLAALTFVSASVHLANEYTDAETDAATRRTAFSGGSGALSRTGLDPRIALHAALASAVVGLSLGVLGAIVGALPPIALGLLLAGTVGGWAYSLPRSLALNRHGLGEIGNAILGGLLLPVYGFAAASGSMPAWVIAAFLPFALVDLASVLATAWPDRRADEASGKRTLVTRVSPKLLRMIHAASLGAAGVVTAVVTGRAIPSTVALASLVLVPPALIATTRMTSTESPLWSVATMVGLIVALLLGWLLVPPGSWLPGGSA